MVFNLPTVPSESLKLELGKNQGCSTIREKNTFEFQYTSTNFFKVNPEQVGRE
jgi:hypothetical protein